MEPRRIPIQNRLKMYRRRVGLSQKQVAKRLGLKDTSPVSRWESGLMYPSIAYVFQLSRIYNTIPQEFYPNLWQSITRDHIQYEHNLLAQEEIS